jgi:hypothetical protein
LEDGKPETEVGRQKTGDGSGRLELKVGSGKHEAGSWKTEDRRRKTWDGKTEVQSLEKARRQEQEAKSYKPK